MSNKNTKDLKLETKVIHVGGEPDKLTGAVIPPIYQTSTFAQKSPGKHDGYEYSRSHNPTRDRLEECLAALESGKYCLVTASGMSAITLLMHSLEKDDVVLCGDDVYGGTNRLFQNVFHKTLKFDFVDTTNLEALEQHLAQRKVKMIWVETPTNPMLKISDIQKISQLAKKYKSLLVVDNTFMSPIFQRPLELGADVVIHSMTKYINGHSDVVGGALILNNKKLYDKLWFLQNSIGPSQSPFDSWLVLRGVKTLAIRMKETNKSALKIAQLLELNRKIESVIYPGLPSHPQHKLAKKQMDGFGGIISFTLTGGLKEARKFLESVKIFRLAESLGGVESLIEHPAIMTHASVPKEMRDQLGISNSLIRLSIGIENVDDLIDDLNQALAKI